MLTHIELRVLSDEELWAKYLPVFTQCARFWNFNRFLHRVDSNLLSAHFSSQSQLEFVTSDSYGIVEL